MYLFIYLYKSIFVCQSSLFRPACDHDYFCEGMRERCSVSFSIRTDGILRGSEYPVITPWNRMEKIAVHRGGWACSLAFLCVVPLLNIPSSQASCVLVSFLPHLPKWKVPPFVWNSGTPACSKKRLNCALCTSLSLPLSKSWIKGWVDHHEKISIYICYTMFSALWWKKVL